MNLEEIRRTFISRLDEGFRADRGWFIIMRVLVTISWLKSNAECLENCGGGKSIQLTKHDYQSLAQMMGTKSDDRSLQLRYHHLLVMEKPLQLLQRVTAQN